MKLLIVAGGGGHFAPALAVIDALPKDVHVRVIGRKYTFEGEKTISLEYQTAKKLGIPFETITTGRLQRKLTKHSLLSIAKIPVGFFQALALIKKYDPDVLLSFGGYVSVPVALAAWSLRVPIVIHEQTLGAGLANKIVAKFAKKICISWKESEKYFPRKKVILTGNPLRNVILNQVKNPDLENILRFAQDDKKVLYITGGSSGAHAINSLIEGCLEKLLEKYIVIHQTGDAKQFGDFSRLRNIQEALPNALKKRYILTKFVDSTEVFSVLDKADLVISRSGINTITELIFLGKPSLFIPLPFGQRDEQVTNALFLKNLGIAEVAEQQTLTPGKLYDVINTMIKNIADYKRHMVEVQKLLDGSAAQRIIDLVIHASKQSKTTKS